MELAKLDVKYLHCSHLQKLLSKIVLPSGSCFQVQDGWGSLIPPAQVLGLCCWWFWRWAGHLASFSGVGAVFSGLPELSVNTMPLLLCKSCAPGKSFVWSDKRQS